jgi:hypothetical protein
MGTRAWDFLWDLAKVAPDVQQAARAVHLTTSIRIGAIKAGKTGPGGGSRSLIMSLVDFRNTVRNLADPHVRAQLAQSPRQVRRIDHIDSDEEEDPFVPVRFLCLLLPLLSSLFFVVIFHVVFEVSLLVEVRLRAALSAPKRTLVAHDAPALFSAG